MKVRDLTFTAIFAALICVAAPWTVPVGPIPITLATLAVYLAAAVLGWKKGTVAVVVYLLLGAVGVPVFSGFSGGFARLIGPTGGYLVGYIPCALLTGLVSDRFPKPWGYAVGMVLGTVVLYALGTAWFCVQSGSELGHALAVCVVPFLIGDAIKIAAAIVLASILRPVLERMKGTAAA